MMHASVKTYMSLDEFTGMIRNNNKKFISFGGTVSAGAKAFSEYSNTLLRSGGPARETLIQMGYSASQVNQQLINYMDKVYQGTSLETVDRERLTDSFVNYQVNLHKLTALTGKQADKIEDEMKVASDDAVFRMTLNQLNTTQRNQIMNMLTQYTAMWGEAGAQMFRSAFLGFTPQTELAQNLHYLVPDLHGQMMSMSRGVRGSAEGLANFDQTLQTSRRQQIRQMISSYKANRSLFLAQAAGDQQLSSFVRAFEGPMGLLARFGQDIDTITDAQIDGLMEEIDREANSRDSITKALRDFEFMVREFKVGFFDVVFGPDGPFKQFSTDANLTDFTTRAEQLGGALGRLTADVMPSVMRFFAKLALPEGRNLFKAQLGHLMEQIAIRMSYLIPRMFSDNPAFGSEAMNRALALHSSEFAPLLQELEYNAERAVDQALPSSSRPANVPTAGSAIQRFMDWVSQSEAGSNPNAFNYSNGNGGYSIGNSARIGGRNISDLTVGELMALQREGTVHAAGLYQLTPGTLRGAVNGSGISLNAKFDRDTQAALMSWVIRNARPELYRYLTGGTADESRAALQAAQEWAALPVISDMQGHRQAVTRGQSYYHGFGGNRARETPEALLEVMRSIRGSQTAAPRGAQSLGTLGSLGRAFGSYGSGGTVTTVHGNEAIMDQDTFTEIIRSTGDPALGTEIEILDKHLSSLIMLTHRRISLNKQIRENQARHVTNKFALT